MNYEQKMRKNRVGIISIASRRFRSLGEGTAQGTYYDRIARESKHIIQSLEEELEVINPGPISDEHELQQALQLFHTTSPDCLLIYFHSWAEDNVWIRCLRDLDPAIPLIYYYPAKESIPFEDCSSEDDFVQFLSCGGLVGSLVGSGPITRGGREAHVIVGSISTVGHKIISYVRMCAIRTIIRSSRIGIIPSYNEIMWSTYIDPYKLFFLGPEVTFISYDQLCEAAQTITLDDIQQYQEELRSTYPADHTLDEEKFAASVKYSIALMRVMKLYDCDVLTLNDVNMHLFEKIGLRPGFYPKEISTSLSVLCPEADLGIGVAQYLLKLISGGKQVNIIEPFYIDEQRDLFCAGHAGPNDYNGSESEKQVLLSVDARFAKTHYRYAGAPFAYLRIAEGRMTMIHISQGEKRCKLVATVVDSLAGPHRINGYSHSEFRAVTSSLQELFTSLLRIGTTQHFAVVRGDYLEELRDFASLCDIDFYCV